jgi:hypothetical protein
MNKGDDVLTTLLGGFVGFVFFGIGIILVLSWIFN